MVERNHLIAAVADPQNFASPNSQSTRRDELRDAFDSSPSWSDTRGSVSSHVASATPTSRLDGGTDARPELLGLSFDAVTMESAVARCLEFCRSPRVSHSVVTANAYHICMARRDPELASACRAAHLVVADGMSVVWALRASGQRIPERVAGVDLMTHLLAAAQEHKLCVYFLGAKREVVTNLVKMCRIRYPGLEVAGFRDGYFGPQDNETVVENIRASGADILFVGMPSPFKETWCERHRQSLAVPVILGVGGSFDVLAGYIRRAPRWMQRLGLEWLWRLLMEPRKLWKRYFTTIGEFVWIAGWEIVARRLGWQKAAEAHN